MKTLNWIIVLLLAGMIFLGGFFVGERVGQYRVPSGKVLVEKVFLDSLKNLRPDTIRIDSLVIEERIITIEKEKEVLVPIPITADLNFYSDTTVTDSLWLVINDTIQGELLHRNIQYKPVSLITEIHTPYPVIVEKEIYRYHPAVYKGYIGGQTIFNPGFYAGGLEIGIQTPKNINLAMGLITDGYEPYFTFRTGMSFEFDWIKWLQIVF